MQISTITFILIAGAFHVAHGQVCNATAFEPTAIQVDNSTLTGVNQTKVFDCVCPTGVESFVAECQSDLNWNYTANTIPCRAACDASEVTFASPGNASFMCGVQPFTCNSRLSCAPNTFDLECAEDGTWVSLENKCIEETCSIDSIEDICQDKCQTMPIVSEITCGEPLNYNCVDGAVASSHPVVCNASNSFNNSGPLCFFNESCQGTCNRSSIEDICDDYCEYVNTAEMACGEPLNYYCVDSARQASPLRIVCYASNSFNNSDLLCICDDSLRWPSYGVAFFSTLFDTGLVGYLLHWYGERLSKQHKPEGKVAFCSSWLPGILLVFNAILDFLLFFLSFLNPCSPEMYIATICIDIVLISLTFADIFVIVRSDQNEYLESQSTSRWSLFKELASAPWSPPERNAKVGPDAQKCTEEL